MKKLKNYKHLNKWCKHGLWKYIIIAAIVSVVSVAIVLLCYPSTDTGFFVCLGLIIAVDALFLIPCLFIYESRRKQFKKFTDAELVKLNEAFLKTERMGSYWVTEGALIVKGKDLSFIPIRDILWIYNRHVHITGITDWKDDTLIIGKNKKTLCIAPNIELARLRAELVRYNRGIYYGYSDELNNMFRKKFKSMLAACEAANVEKLCKQNNTEKPCHWVTNNKTIATFENVSQENTSDLLLNYDAKHDSQKEKTEFASSHLESRAGMIRYELEHKTIRELFYKDPRRFVIAAHSSKGEFIRELYKSILGDDFSYSPNEFNVLGISESGEDIYILRDDLPFPESFPLCCRMYFVHNAEFENTMMYTIERAIQGGYLCKWSKDETHYNVSSIGNPDFRGQNDPERLKLLYHFEELAVVSDYICEPEVLRHATECMRNINGI